MEGKVIIITGANSGIGFEAARVLGGQGHHVIMACRTEERAMAAIDKIKKEHQDAKLTFIQLELTNMESVRKFAEEFCGLGLSLFALVNNAGVAFFGSTGRKTTEAGWELTFASNHLGHFLLTHLLLDELKKTASSEGEARIVNVTSELHSREMATKMNRSSVEIKEMDMDDLMLEKEGAYTGIQAYRNSKCANVLFTKLLADKLEGSGVTVNCMTPGFIPDTGLARHSNALMRFVMTYILGGIVRRFTSNEHFRTIQQGAGDIILLSTAPELKGKTGDYYELSKVAETDEECLDTEQQHKLWQLSENLVGLASSDKTDSDYEKPNPDSTTD